MNNSISSILLMILLSCFYYTGCAEKSENIEKQHVQFDKDAAEEKMIFVCAAPENSKWGKYLKLLYTEAFSRLNIKFELKHLPAKRATKMTDMELADGDLWRIPAYGKLHQNLIFIDYRVTAVTYSAYAYKPGIRIAGKWNGFKNTNYNVSYRHGVLYSEMNLRPYVKKSNLSAANSVIIALRKLQKKRIDIFVGITGDVDAVLKTEEFRNSGIYRVKIIESTGGYPFLLKKHRSLAPKLKDVLSKIEKEGLFKKFKIISEKLNSNNKGIPQIDNFYLANITLVMATKPESHEGKWLKMIYTEAFRRAGIKLDLRYYPGKRCSILTDNESVDGDIWRVYSYNEEHPNLIRVEEPTYTAYFSAYAINNNIILNGWESLRGTKYRIDYRRGVKMSEVNLPKVVQKENLLAVNSVYSGLSRLLKKRSDIFIGVQGSIQDELNNIDFKNSNIHRVGIMEKITTHCWLLKKHKSLASELSIILRQLRQEGIIRKYKKISGRMD